MRLIRLSTAALVLVLAATLPAHADFDHATVAFEKGDYAQALAELRPLAKQRDPRSQCDVGVMAENGFGMPVNYAQAARWYRPAAESGDLDALSNLGVLYETGRGVQQDKVLALALYDVSVAFETGKDSQAERNRQGLANRMSLDEVKRAMALTDQLLKPNQLKPGLQAYWRRQK